VKACRVLRALLDSLHLDGGGGKGAPAPASFVIAAALSALVLAAGCAPSVSGEEIRPEAPSLKPAPDLPGIAVVVAVGGDEIQRTHSINTSLVVDDDVTVTARMGGIVEEILVDRGSLVKKDDPLLVLKNRDLKLYLERAELNLELATLEFDRIRTLFEEKTISASQFDISRLTLESARVDVEIAREDLERSIVRAPFNGVIIDRFARHGQKVIEDDDLPLFRIITLSPLLARLYLPEEVSRGLRQGDEVEITPRHHRSGSVKGVVRWLSRVVDASSGTRQAIVTVGQQKGFDWLVPGTAVTVLLHLSADTHPAVLIPRAALTNGVMERAGEMSRVRVLNEDGYLWREIRLGRFRGKDVEVLEGLTPGERVVLASEGRSPSSER
jgi:RND family efflux transporter MFP subunit